MNEDSYITKKGAIAIAIILIALIIFSLIFYRTRRTGNYAVIFHYGKETGSYPLGLNREIRIKDKKGRLTNIVCIKNGYVYMKEANCPDKICIHQGKKSKVSETITCLPNRVVVEVKGRETGSLDTMTH